MNDPKMLYHELCGSILELLQQLQRLNKIVKNDSINLKEIDNHAFLLVENHHFHLESLLGIFLKKYNEITKLENANLL